MVRSNCSEPIVSKSLHQIRHREWIFLRGSWNKFWIILFWALPRWNFLIGVKVSSKCLGKYFSNFCEQGISTYYSQSYIKLKNNPNRIYLELSSDEKQIHNSNVRLFVKSNGINDRDIASYYSSLFYNSKQSKETPTELCSDRHTNDRSLPTLWYKMPTNSFAYC